MKTPPTKTRPQVKHINHEDALREESLVQIPRVRDVVAGFPCQDVTRLSSFRAGHSSVVRDATLRTGAVFGALKDYCADDEELEALTTENVVGLRDALGSFITPTDKED